MVGLPLGRIGPCSDGIANPEARFDAVRGKGARVRYTLLILSLLGSLAWLSVQLPETDAPANPSPTWRRTAEGWKDANAWHAIPPHTDAGIPPWTDQMHPLAFAGAQLLGALGALTFFSRHKPKPNRASLGTPPSPDLRSKSGP